MQINLSELATYILHSTYSIYCEATAKDDPTRLYWGGLISFFQRGTRVAATSTYSVPNRFGLSAILAFTTIFAITSGILRRVDAPWSVYLFFGVLGTTVCIAQMLSRDAPRLISIITGAICLPVFFVIEESFQGRGFEGLLGAPCAAVAGAIAGYLAGAISAGVFLVTDLLEAHLRAKRLGKKPPLTAEALPDDVPIYSPDSCTPYLGESAAKLTSGTTAMNDSEPAASAPRVKKLGPPTGVPVYNCIALVSPRGPDGLVHVRAANVSDLKTSGSSEREALQHLVGAFKIIVSQAVAAGREVPLLAERHPRREDETERFIAVHL